MDTPGNESTPSPHDSVIETVARKLVDIGTEWAETADAARTYRNLIDLYWLNKPLLEEDERDRLHSLAMQFGIDAGIDPQEAMRIRFAALPESKSPTA